MTDGNPLTLSHRTRTPYFNATLQVLFFFGLNCGEIHRLSNIVTMAVWRKSTTTAQVGEKRN